MAHLILVRHGKSEWNEKGLWTGFQDVSLAQAGMKEAQDAGAAIKDIHIDLAFTSALKRAQETLDEILKTTGQTDIPIIKDAALNERDYGEMTGKNKWEIKEQYGEEQFLKWRRGWNEPIPGGETLKDVYERVVPYYKENILPSLKDGKNVLIAAHGNSLRALVKYLENITEDGVTKLEIATGEVYVYEIDNQGTIIKKEIRAAHENTV